MKKISLLFLVSILSFSGISQNAFAFDLFNVMNKQNNVLFSPTSIKSAFAMAYEGANSQTQTEFEEVFGFKEQNTDFLAEMEHLKKAAEINNSVWILEKYEVLQSYLDAMKTNFDSEVYWTDFKQESEKSAKKINDWIDKSTKGMIKKMVNASDVAPFKMALINAIYFKQSWKNPFDSTETKTESFMNFSGSTSNVDMMHAHQYYRAYSGQNEKVIELPYDDNRTAMIIILPNQMEGYELTNETYDNLIAKLRTQDVSLDLPKFTFETPTFELKSHLQQLGISAAFSDGADFSGMREQRDLKIGTALHKAKIIVNEEGTEAAAVTIIGMVETTSMSAPKNIILKIRVDKPFYYFIKDVESGAILFMGRMNEMMDIED